MAQTTEYFSEWLKAKISLVRRIDDFRSGSDLSDEQVAETLRQHADKIEEAEE